ncbi:MAG: hypothetical protein JW937_09815 [Candidatus Omnitrophica bacterium]|nr:hypothetical protein [Candidatus Omnitrophota bacterium]
MSGQTSTILIASPKVGQSTLLSRTLLREHYKIIESADGFETLQKMRCQPVDLAVVPEAMPRLSGSQIVSRVLEECPDTVCLFLTQNTQGAQVEKMLQTRRCWVMGIPESFQDLYPVIRETLHQRDLVMENSNLQQMVRDLHWKVEELQDLKQNAEERVVLAQEARQAMDARKLAWGHLLGKGAKVVASEIEKVQKSLGHKQDQIALYHSARSQLETLSVLSAGMEGNLRGRPEPVDLQRLVQKLIKERQQMVSKKSLELEVCIPPDLPTVQGDARLIACALRNLLSFVTHAEEEPVPANEAYFTDHKTLPLLPLPRLELAYSFSSIFLAFDHLQFPGGLSQDAEGLFWQDCPDEQAAALCGAQEKRYGVALTTARLIFEAHGGSAWVEWGSQGLPRVCATLPLEA